MLRAVQLGFDQRQHRGELGEQQHAAAFGEQFVEHLQQAAELARVQAGQLAVAFLTEQAQVAAGLAQAQQRFENHDLAAGQTLAGDLVTHLLVHGQAQGFVAVALRALSSTQWVISVFGGSSLATCSLVRRRIKGLIRPVRCAKRMFVGVFLNRCAVVAGKAFAVAEPAGHEEVEQRPQLAQVVFQRRAGQAQALLGLEACPAAMAALLRGFLMFCASSRISRR